ncbi:MAG: M48 family metallopeptidase [Bacteroidia bacterium]|nr:M48 family metallopeptidase [Bacteroidia bacterium]
MQIFYGTLFTQGGESLPVEIGITLYHLELKTDYSQFIWKTNQLRSNEKADKITIHHEDGMWIECTQPGFKDQLIKYHPKSGLNPNAKPQFGPAPFGKISLVISGILLAGIAFYWWGIPAIGNWIGNHLPVSVEKELGKNMFDQMKGQWAIDKDRSQAIQEFYKQLQEQSEYSYHVVVVKEDVVNAFAMPGGYIVVYDGLLKKMKNHEELAGLLAHESSHVQYHHTSRTLCTTLANYLFFSAIIGDINGVVAILAQNADQIKSLSYSRDLETEADLKGLELLYRKNIDPKGMLGLMQTLKQEELSNGGTIPEFASTHPLPDSRISTLQEYIKQHPIQAKKDSVMEACWNRIKF